MIDTSLERFINICDKWEIMVYTEKLFKTLDNKGKRVYSLRKISNIIEKTYKIKIHYSTISLWAKNNEWDLSKYKDENESISKDTKYEIINFVKELYFQYDCNFKTHKQKNRHLYSYQDISNQIKIEYGFSFHKSTICKWCDKYGFNDKWNEILNNSKLKSITLLNNKSFDL